MITPGAMNVLTLSDGIKVQSLEIMNKTFRIPSQEILPDFCYSE